MKPSFQETLVYVVFKPFFILTVQVPCTHTQTTLSHDCGRH